MRLREFAPAGGGGSGDYFQALASAWYNGVFDTGSLQKGIKSQEDVERLLNRGIVCPDGKTRKLHIDYNSDFDGVEIYSDDYYEYGDHDDTIDSRTGQKWGPYDFMAFSDEDLSEGLNEVDRRGFLKGAGVAAVAGAAGYKMGQDQGTKKNTQVPNDPVAYYLLGYFWGFSYLEFYSKQIENWYKNVEPYLQDAMLKMRSNAVDDKLKSAYEKGFSEGREAAELREKIGGREKAAEYFSKYWERAYNKLISILHQSNESVNQSVAEGSLNEFAPDSNDGGGEDDALRNYARMWWAGDEATQMQIESALARMGWEIGEDEGGYDNGGVFVVRAGDENGNSYQSWAAEDLTEGLTEVDRRGFLKGLGAAAVAGAAGGAKADWEKEPDYVDKMDDRVIKKWKNVSNDGSATLRFLTTNGKNRQLTLINNGGYWKPSDGIGSRPDSGRIRIDNNPVMNMLFLWASGPANIVLVGGPDGGFGTPAYEQMTDALLTAQSRILIDASRIGGGILEFRPNVKESVSQGVAEGSEDPFGPQGRFVGDTGPAQITTTVARVQLKPGDKVLYKPTEQRARIEAMSRDGTKARIHIPSPMGGKTFNCKTSDLKALGALKEKSTSQAQFRTMAAAAHDPKFARKVGIKQSVAREFNKADKGQSYKSLPKKAD